ncbi:MAG TPA: BadF/BadG/BcrA/BcrD ATPase family protein [Armatimonadota bacterium]|nr:BadF/BadG/BcrA/BcrD ATPase family protein [Armatimonadota bacterium]
MPVVLGIDQGGTHTRAVVAGVDGCLLGMGISSGAYHAYDGMERAMTEARDAALAALNASGCRAEDILSIYGGFTGADWPDEYELLADAVRGLGLCSDVMVANDSIIAMRGGTDCSFGAVLIAGTGSNCAVRSPDGREFIYHYYHDETLQGGGALGSHTLDLIFQAQTGRVPATSLAGRVLSFYQLDTVDALLRSLVENRLPGGREGLKELAPLVFEEAYRGDAGAAGILRRFGEGSAELVVNGLRRFDMLQMEVDVVLSGSVFKGEGPLLVDCLTAGIHMAAPRARLVNARYEPVVGAVLLGLERQGITGDELFKQNLEHSAAELGLIRGGGI